MSRHFLIDGYNVLHKMPGLVPEAGLSLEEARNGLIKFITEKRPHGNMRNSVMVVFDGSESVYFFDIPGEVKILFSRGEDADTLIKRLIDELSNPREWVMVSDDRDLQHYAGVHALDIWSVARFVDQGKKNSRLGLPKSRLATDRADDKAIGEVFKDKLNRELEKKWLGQKGR